MHASMMLVLHLCTNIIITGRRYFDPDTDSNGRKCYQHVNALGFLTGHELRSSGHAGDLQLGREARRIYFISVLLLTLSKVMDRLSEHVC